MNQFRFRGSVRSEVLMCGNVVVEVFRSKLKSRVEWSMGEQRGADETRRKGNRIQSSQLE